MGAQHFRQAFAVVTGLMSAAVSLALVSVVFLPYLALSAVHPAERHRLPLPAPWREWLPGAVHEEEGELLAAIRTSPGPPGDAVVAAAALAIVVAASVTMERTASVLGTRWSVPGIVTGGLVLAAVTSLPDAVTAIYLANRGRAAATLSVALTRNTLNVVVGLLLPGVFLGLGWPASGDLLVAGGYAELTLITLALAYGGMTCAAAPPRSSLLSMRCSWCCS